MAETVHIHRGKALVAGLVGGVFGHGVMGLLFYSPVSQKILLSDPRHTEVFLQVASPDKIPICAAGIIVLSVLHGLFYSIFAPSIPGATWLKKGLFWGFTIWCMYWLFQIWLIYTMLLGFPTWLNLYELTLLLIGALVEGVVIAGILHRWR